MDSAQDRAEMHNNESLTQMQLLGVASDTNVAEGHPRQALTVGQRAVVGRFPEFLAESVRESYPVLEARAHRAFFGALGQHSAPTGTGRVISFYSSSVAIDVVCRCLAAAVTSVGVIHPTLDCIPALLESRGLALVPISERNLRPAKVNQIPEVGAVFVASPNNPTGAYLDETALRSLAVLCARRSVPLVIDSCFRAFDPRTQFDMYAVLDETSVEYVVIEDTGKLWPFGGIKLGFLSYSKDNRLPLTAAASDILLTAPSFAALVVEALSQDMAAGGLAQLQDLIASNRRLLAAEIRQSDVLTLVNAASRVSVAMIGLPRRMSSTRLWGALLRAGVHSVPCRPFYWANPSQGERYLRIALAREPEVVQRAAVAVRAESVGQEAALVAS